jgi:hypothetical protein
MPRGGPGIPRKDPLLVRLKAAWNRAVCQARHRGQEWNIPWETYLAMWLEDNRYLSKGNTKGSLVFCRRDIEKGWTEDNVMITSRETYSKQQQEN